MSPGKPELTMTDLTSLKLTGDGVIWETASRNLAREDGSFGAICWKSLLMSVDDILGFSVECIKPLSINIIMGLNDSSNIVLWAEKVVSSGKPASGGEIWLALTVLFYDLYNNDP